MKSLCALLFSTATIMAMQTTPLSDEAIIKSLEALFCKKSLTKEVYTDEELNVFKNYGEFLREHTTEEDIVIFIGRSLFLVHHYWDLSGRLDNRTYFSVSYSGKAQKPPRTI